MATTIRKSEIQAAIESARKYAPADWQAEMLEIARLPKVSSGVNRIDQNRQFGHRLAVKRASSKFGPGYSVEGWNDNPRPDFYWNNPARAWDGVRRDFYGAHDIDKMRMFALTHNINLLYELKYFRVVD